MKIMRGKSREEVTRVEKRCNEKNEMRKYIARKMHTNVNECERQLKEKGGFAICFLPWNEDTK